MVCSKNLYHIKKSRQHGLTCGRAIWELNVSHVDLRGYEVGRLEVVWPQSRIIKFQGLGMDSATRADTSHSLD